MKIKVEANACFKEVDHSKKRYIVMKGSAGSGKSMDSAQNYIIRLMNDPGRNLLCVRKADVTNRDSTFAELQSAIFRMFGESYKKYWYINTSNMLLECKNPENYDYIVNSQDFGFNHANCIGEVGFKDGDLYLFQELYVYEMDTEEIIKLAAGRFNKKLRMWCDSAEPDRIKMWQKAGYRAKGVNKETNSVHAQIDYLKQHMIHIHPSCVNTIKEIQQWKWKKDERTNTYLEEPVPFFDDAMAMLRYSIEEERKAKPKLNRNLKGGL